MTLLERIRQRLEAFGQSRDLTLMTRLFCEDLGWGEPRGFTQRRLQLPSPLSCEVQAVPVAQMSGLPVYCVEWPQERLPGVTARRAVQRALSPLSAEHVVCYLTQDGRQLAFTWARRRSDGKIELRTLPYEVGSPARTTIERLAKMAFSPDELGPTGQPSITAVTDKLNRAFDVEAVTKQFFANYRRVFDDLRKRLLAQLRADQQCPDAQRWAHNYALQLLNRLMFLYFIQRKGWLGGNPHFLRHFWESYKRSGQPRDSFFSQWLRVLFFEAFNNKFHGGHRHFPEDIRRVLQLAPFLNGGLFRENQLDTAYAVNPPDEFFEQLFDRFNGSTPGFLERYNFTIAESTPFDVEVAVDPEMIGKVYESLVNITFEGLTEEDEELTEEDEELTEEDLRRRAGIFYTPRVEIDLMCRLALVDALSNRLGAEFRPLLYDVVFATDPDEKESADAALTAHNLWSRFNDALRSLTICDPACGSGSFLVGMLLVLDDLQARANQQLGIEETPYERRRRIIGNQLYGVDVMDWAVHVAELRLWLQLIVETEIHPAELQLRPLLPNLSFKVRQGDSLVQEIAGINLGLHRQHLEIPAQLKGKLTQLKGKKLRFYQGGEHITEAALKHEELQLFREILLHKIHSLQNEIAMLNREIAHLGSQTELPGMATAPNSRTPGAREAELHAKLEEKQDDLARFQDALNALKTVQDVPFVWDIAFVEIFEGDSGGFDIVIGNPPYVRQEKIAPPLEREENYTPDEWRRRKAAYKKKLQHSVAAAWPRFFQYKPGSDTFRKPDGRSDLYIYFYFHALSLLNPQGSFCFITSNSWLDVGYGAELQEFLLRHSHVKLVLDNEAKRSFARADVNTVIVLLAPPDDRREDGLSKTARFVMFEKPFEEVARAEVFKAIEAATERQSTPDYRVTARLQRELLEEGLESDADDVGATPRGCPQPPVVAQPTPRGRAQSGKAQGPAPTGKSHGPLIKTARYIGNKWGGKYLRAPDIFFTILEKGKGKLVRLGDIAEVRFGIKTGANEFFYLEPTGNPAPAGYLHVRNGAGWEGEIEEEFLKPVIKSPRECRSILIKPEDLRYKIFMCHRDKSELKGTAALEYIRWGETQRYHERPSCRGRQRWWDLGQQEPFDFVILRFRHERNWTPVNITPSLLAGDIMFVGSWSNRKAVNACNAIANSTFAVFISELLGRVNLGEGLLTTYGPEILRFLAIHPSSLNPQTEEMLMQRFQLLITRDVLPIYDEIHQPDRRALDEVVFDVLGLTAGEREAVYEAVVNLVRARLERAQSV
jgi:hypothetical protein